MFFPLLPAESNRVQRSLPVSYESLAWHAYSLSVAIRNVPFGCYCRHSCIHIHMSVWPEAIVFLLQMISFMP